MAHEQGCDSLRLCRPDDREERHDLLLGKGRRWLIHDDEAGVLQEGLGYGDQLPIGHREVSGAGIQGMRTLTFSSASAAMARISRQIDEFAFSCDQLVGGQILGHRQVRKEREVLIDDLDALADRIDRVQAVERPAVDRRFRRCPARGRRR